MIPRHLAPRHLAARPLVFAAATLAAATLFVTTLSGAQEPAHRPSAGRSERQGNRVNRSASSVRTALEGAVMCVVEPVNPPPCAAPKPAAR